MSVEFDVTIGETWLGLDAYSTHLTIEVGPKDPDGAENRPLPMTTFVEGWAITLPAVEARNLRRFLEYAYPASEDKPTDTLVAQRPATTRPGDLPAALPSATAESDGSIPRAPAREGTVRPPSTYEMDPDGEASAFEEPEYQSRRKGYR